MKKSKEKNPRLGEMKKMMNFFVFLKMNINEEKIRKIKKMKKNEQK